MVKAFEDYVQQNHLLRSGAKVLVALSGGLDSVVLTHLLHQSGYVLEIAHCHFGLRGKEADQDQQFSKELAAFLQVPFHTITFDTKQYAAENKVSIQMAARQLRYEWLSKTLHSIGADAIALAHHQDDQVETQLLNLIRGTGFAGLRGMKNKRGFFIRPLLFATRLEILEFARQNNWHWRDDSSNKKIVYKRNFIRHKIIPLLATLNPSYREAFSKLEQQAFWAEKTLEEKRFFFQKKCFTVTGEKQLIYLMKWHSLQESEFFLKQLLGDYGFNASDIGQLFRHYPPQPGTNLLSKTHKLLVNRDHWQLAPLHNIQRDACYILQGETGILETEDFKFKWQLFHTPFLPEISRISETATLTFPEGAELSLRFWQEGDRFIPLGMKGEKKLSDFFIDQKIDLDVKTQIPLLCINGEIAWICGLRISEKFKYTDKATSILSVHFERGT